MAFSVKAAKPTGFAETMTALRQLDKNAARRINVAIKKAAEDVAAEARSLVVGDVLSGFARQMPGGTAGTRRKAYGNGYDDDLVRKGIKVKMRRPRKRGPAVQSFVIVANTTPLGVIWETAGRRSTGKTPAGRAMIRNIRTRDGVPNRTVWRAADRTDMGAVRRKIEEQMALARSLCQQQINRA